MNPVDPAHPRRGPLILRKVTAERGRYWKRKLVLDYALGATMQELAADLGISIQRVSQIIIDVQHRVKGTNSTALDLSLKLRRYGRYVPPDTPEAFYWEERFHTKENL